MSSYSLAIINTLVSFGLLLLHTPAYRIRGWNPPFRAPKTIIGLFFSSNLFLIAVPLIPPSSGSGVYEHLPYWVSLDHHLFSSSATLFLNVPGTPSYMSWLPSPSHLLEWRTGISGVYGSRRGAVICFSGSGFFRTTVFPDMYSIESRNRQCIAINQLRTYRTLLTDVHLVCPGPMNCVRRHDLSFSPSLFFACEAMGPPCSPTSTPT